jgi:hypothetical protein
MVCQRLACPNCHLVIPRVLLEFKPVFVSILGAPGSGKSYFLASMTWQLRKAMLSRFQATFGDADPVANQVLIDYEERLFLSHNSDQPTALAKTEQRGNLYQSVRFGEQEIWYPRPFVFSVDPTQDHPGFAQRRRIARALCLYDNAGEHFLPGAETGIEPATQHLALSGVVQFLFDPTQHPEFRRACKVHSNDPQLGDRGWSYRQDLVLQEAARRIRDKTGLPQDQKDPRPLIIVVTKYDVWRQLVPKLRIENGRVFRRLAKPAIEILDTEQIVAVSNQVRQLLSEYAPEVVGAAERFASNVTYVPVSALGQSPLSVESQPLLCIRPCDIRPLWVEVPMLYALHKATSKLLFSVEEVRSRRS